MLDDNFTLILVTVNCRNAYVISDFAKGIEIFQIKNIFVVKQSKIYQFQYNNKQKTLQHYLS